MPEDERPEGEQEQEPGAPEENEQEPWDAERAMATIRKLRDVEKQLKAQAKEQASQLEAYETERKKRAQDELSELERAQAQLREAEEREARMQSQLTDLRLRQGFLDAVDRAGLQFVSPEARSDAFVLALAELELDGEETNAEKVLAGMKKNRGYLFGSAPAPDIDGQAKGKGRQQVDEQKIRNKYGI